jgi:hypothetical protein
MADLKAFVGHSFTKDDAGVVGKFLQHFDRLSKVMPNFSWVHAEAAEPKELSTKVLSLIIDRNLFIGICTKKEMVISPDLLKSSIFRGDILRGNANSFAWKTSDWIIQEIGMAKGRGLDMILLLEDGIRRPGGLQGDVEYISFERNAPEKSFDKILEMLTSLSPKATPTAVRTSEAETTSAATSEAAEDSSDLGPRLIKSTTR